MAFDKNYYAILGILPTAEDVVIRAAYKALAQRYHPDRFQGSAEEATRRMKDLNEAYAVLSDPVRRKEYDEWFSRQQGAEYQDQEDDPDDELSAAIRSLEADWATACTIFPDLRAIEARLNKTAARLARGYKAVLLDTKEFQKRHAIAEVMEKEFFKAYFGTNPDLVQFAKELVTDGHRKAAKALNNYIRVVGNSADSRLVIDRICDEHGLVNQRQVEEDEARVRRAHEVAKSQAKIEENMRGCALIVLTILIAPVVLAVLNRFFGR